MQKQQICEARRRRPIAARSAAHRRRRWAPGPPWGPGPWGVLLYTLLLNIKLAFGAFDLDNRIGTGIFHARLGKIKVDGNNPQG